MVGTGAPPVAGKAAPPVAPAPPPAPPEAAPSGLDSLVDEALVTGTSTADGVTPVVALAVAEPLVDEIGAAVAGSTPVTGGGGAVELVLEPGAADPTASSDPASPLVPFAAPLLQAQAPRPSPKSRSKEFAQSLEPSHFAGIIRQ